MEHGRSVEVTPDSVTFYVYGRPQAKERPRFSSRSGSFYTPSKTLVSEKAIYTEAQKVVASLRRPYFDELTPVHMDTLFFFHPPKKSKYTFPAKQDLDNLEKTVWDALNGILYHDDKQIVSSSKEKRFTKEPEEYTKITLRRRYTT